MSTSWLCAIRPLPSVNGIVYTSGRVPAARAAVNVGAVQSYSWPSIVIQGYLASNWLTWRLKASNAAWVLPGRRLATRIVTGLCSAAVLGLAAAVLGLAAVVGAAVVPQAASNPAMAAIDATSIDPRLVRVFIPGSPLLTVPTMGDFLIPC